MHISIVIYTAISMQPLFIYIFMHRARNRRQKVESIRARTEKRMLAQSNNNAGISARWNRIEMMQSWTSRNCLGGQIVAKPGPVLGTAK